VLEHVFSIFAAFDDAFTDLCTGGEDQSPEGSIKIVLDVNEYDGTIEQALDYYIIDVSYGCLIFTMR